MPNNTTAKPRGVAFDPRSLSQLSWLMTTAAIVSGRPVSASMIFRLALAELTNRLSGSVASGNLDALRADIDRLPEFARCAPGGTERATDKAGKLQPWKPLQ